MSEDMIERREDPIILADIIVQAWERSSISFDRDHQIQLALIAAKFVIAVADGDAALSPEGEG